MSEFKIKILSDNDFDGLKEQDTRGADISDSMGFADVQNGRIFVRNTGVDELNKFLIDHEIDELLAHESAHEDPLVPGIRHKKFKEVVRAVINPINLPIPGLQNKKRGVFQTGKKSDSGPAVRADNFNRRNIFN